MDTRLWRMHTPDPEDHEHTTRPFAYDPKELWERCCQYFDWLEEHPLQEEKAFMYQGEVIHADERKMRAPTVQGLTAFLGVHRGTWARWKESPHPGIQEVVQRADDIMHDYKFTGAAAGLLNSALIMRDLGLREGVDHSSADGSMSPSASADAVLAAIKAKHDTSADS